MKTWRVPATFTFLISFKDCIWGSVPAWFWLQRACKGRTSICNKPGGLVLGI